MSSLLKVISSWFWNPSIWLPANITWQNFTQESVLNGKVILPDDYAKFSDLWYPIPMALILVLIRWMMERMVFRPLGQRMGLKEKIKKFPANNLVLEKNFRKTLSRTQITNLARETGLSLIQVERWLRQRRAAAAPSKLQKFCETGWRWVYYSTIFLYGMKALLDKPWLWNMKHCWKDYPYHTVDQEIWLYYMLELAFYWSLSFSQFFDVKRKDFWEMFIHHMTTIALMMFSWSTHFTRVGTLVLLIHDSSDHLLELAKIFRYINYRRSCDVVFIIFAIVWVITRCGIYPFFILYSTLHDAGAYIPMFPGYYIFNSLLVTLQILNIVWTYFILKIIYRALTKGEVDDSRSDSEESEGYEEEHEKDR